MLLEFFNIQIYLVFIIIILLISEILKLNNNFSETIMFILNLNSKIPKKYIFGFAVIILGILPIPGRIVLINFLLTSVSNKSNLNLGTLAYISTHHYYLWSPIETAVVISLGILNISYFEFLSYTCYPLLCYMIFFILYIVFYIKDSDFKNIKQLKNIKLNYNTLFDIIILFLIIIISIFLNEKLIVCNFLIFLFFLMFKYKVSIKDIILKLDYKFIISIFIILCIGFIIKTNFILKDLLFQITNTFSLLSIFLICFFLSFLFGSSSKYATIAANISLILGIKFFPLLYIVDYCGYILSPIHKCTFFIFSYFKFKFEFILWLILICLIVFIPSYLIFVSN